MKTASNMAMVNISHFFARGLHTCTAVMCLVCVSNALV